MRLRDNWGDWRQSDIDITTEPVYIPLMELQQVIEEKNIDELLALARNACRAEGYDWDLLRNECGITSILKTLKTYSVLSPKNIKGTTAQANITQFVHKLYKGYCGRISQHTSRPPGTAPDRAVEVILETCLAVTPAEVRVIISSHRLTMSAENITGHLLEEYLWSVLKNHGWYLCWGNTMRSVDFCSYDERRGTARVLQVKNRSNSENSSSSQVRIGTDIEKWHRSNALTGATEWETLHGILGDDHGLSEVNFAQFIRDTLIRNGAALALEPGTPWQRR